VRLFVDQVLIPSTRSSRRSTAPSPAAPPSSWRTASARGTHAQLLARGGRYAEPYEQFVQIDDRPA
jgi:hypothetical protein